MSEALAARRAELEQEFINALVDFSPLQANGNPDNILDPVRFVRRTFSRESGWSQIRDVVVLIAKHSRRSADPETRLECSEWLAGMARVYALETARA